jgi:hypothetical protein
MTMKKTKILILTAMLVSTLFSCQKLVEIKETDLIAGDIALKTVTNNEQGIIGAYAAMNVEMGILLNAVFADEVVSADFYNAATAQQISLSVIVIQLLTCTIVSSTV